METHAAPALVVRALTKRFGAITALDGLDLEVPRGSVFGLVGPNGAGKTTTFGVVCGWVRPDAGEVEILGTRPRRVAELKGRIGALPQDASLPLRLPVRDSLRHLARLQGQGAAEARREVERVLEEMGMAAWGRTPAGALSHGMAKRVGLAQAFIGRPELVLLDEPTAGLDPRSAHELRTAIAGLKGKATVVVSSHNLFEVEALCTEAALIDRGRVVLQGSMETLTAADREVVVELDYPPALHPALLDAALGVAGVATASIEPATDHLVVRFHAPEAKPSELVTGLLRALLAAGAHVGAVRRGTGLERRVLSLDPDAP